LKRQATYFFIILAMPLLFSACKKNKEPKDIAYVLDIPAGFPQMDIPTDNELTVKRVELGKKLFYDPQLSLDATVSCASCHFPDNAFSDVVALSRGVANKTGFRNSPTLANVGYHNSFFKDGGIPTLELQVLAPIEDHREMDFNVKDAVERLSDNAEYQELAKLAYGRAFDAFVLTRAIAAFERTLISGNSRYDQYVSQGDSSALNQSELRGMYLFFSAKTNCSACHSTYLFSDLSFRNNGLYQTYADTGRMRITMAEIDRGKFKVATLRNINLSAPYMHDGSLNTLKEVIEHYNLGGKNHVNKDVLIKPLNLGEEEKTDLINFLKALTDTDFNNNKAHRIE